MRISKSLAGAALGLLAASPAVASKSDILIGLDNSVVFGAHGTDYRAPDHDSVLVVDTTNPTRPYISTSLPLSNSVLGPPANLKITPDGTLGLVASAVHTIKRNGKWIAQPNDVVHVIDLSGKTPRIIGDVKVGLKPAGLAISRDGTFALVTNSVGKSVSVLKIDGKAVTHLTDVPMGDAVVAVAITPDGRRAFVAKPSVGKLGVLSIDGDRVSYDADDDIPTGINTFNVAVTPDGALAIALNAPPKGSSGYLNIVEATGPHPHTIDTVAVGDGPEGMAIAPDGKSAAVLLLHGGTAAHDDWSYHRNGGMIALAIDGKHVRLVPGEVPMGAVPEGVAFSGDGRFVYAGDFNDTILHVVAMQEGRLHDTGVKIKLPGPPASIGSIAH